MTYMSKNKVQKNLSLTPDAAEIVKIASDVIGGKMEGIIASAGIILFLRSSSEEKAKILMEVISGQFDKFPSLDPQFIKKFENIGNKSHKKPKRKVCQSSDRVG